MKTSEYLNKCKTQLGLQSDYALAKMWEIDDGMLSRYKSGKLKPDVYLCFKIAETLHESPTKVIAELESENQRNEVKSLYFKRFFSIVGLWITLGLMLPNLGTSYGIASSAGKVAEMASISHNSPLYEVVIAFIRRLLRLEKRHKCRLFYV